MLSLPANDETVTDGKDFIDRVDIVELIVVLDAELGGEKDALVEEDIGAKKDAKGKELFFIASGQVVVVGVVSEPGESAILVDREHATNAIKVVHEFGCGTCGNSHGLGCSLDTELVKTDNGCH